MLTTQTAITFTFFILLASAGFVCGNLHHGSAAVEKESLDKILDGQATDGEIQEFFSPDKVDGEAMEEYFDALENMPTSLAVADRIHEAGYPVEIHTVQTEDGYILKMIRIPYGKQSPSAKNKKPIFMMHAFLESANGWIVQGPGKSLAYLLADAGYDVWMGNARGTEISRQHVTLDPEKEEFWAYSWQHIGQKDLPAFIDYILEKTQYKKVTYVGYSQGTTTFLVLTSMRPEYNDKILESFLLGPAAYLNNTQNKFHRTMSRYYSPLKNLCSAMGVHKITVQNQKILKFAEWFCRSANQEDSYGCNMLIWFMGSDQINSTILPNILEFTPAGVSLGQVMHFAQLIRSGDFMHFDYDDKLTNWIHYGQTTPPPYALENISAPVNLYLSEDDGTATYQDALRLKARLPNVKETFVVPISGFDHIDFIYSKYAPEKLYKKLIADINNANEI